MLQAPFIVAVLFYAYQLIQFNDFNDILHTEEKKTTKIDINSIGIYNSMLGGLALRRTHTIKQVTETKIK